jgi:4'-phosphopantetheinyl transferase
MPSIDGTGDVHISYCLTATLDDKTVSAALDGLSLEERSRAERLVFDEDRRAFVAAHTLLRTSLSMQSARAPKDWRFVPGTHGKPMVDTESADERRLAFSIAHTGGLAACAISRIADVGIDVETIDHARNELELSRRYFASSEVAELERCSPDARPERFAEIWTLKEAYLKAIGTGLSQPLDSFAFLFNEPQSIRFEPNDEPNGHCWYFAVFVPSARHRLAVAISGVPKPTLHVARFDNLSDARTDIPMPVLRTSRAVV